MKSWILTQLLKQPEFRGKSRLVNVLRAEMGCLRRTMSLGFEMELDCDEWTQLHLVQHGAIEPLTMSLVQRLLKAGDTFVDIGSHVGYVSLVARMSVGDAGLVVAVDPQPYNCHRLLCNWEINGFTNVEMVVAAAGSEPCVAVLPQQSRSDKSRLSLVFAMPDATSLTFRVPIRTVDSILEELSIERVRILKLDVEGYELEVLKGCKNRLNQIDHIIFEALPGESDDWGRCRDVCDWLCCEGFEIRTIQGRPWTEGQTIPESNLWAVRPGFCSA
jgi:FkbM family methyltransferase